MADTTNLNQFLTDVANSIRTKKGTAEEIPAENFDQEILSIETGIDTSDADATANNLESGKTAYVNGEKITGTLPRETEYQINGFTEDMDNVSMKNYTGEDVIEITKNLFRPSQIIDGNGTITGFIQPDTMANAANITPEKIVYGERILNITGDADINTTLNSQIFSHSETNNDPKQTATINIDASIGNYVYGFVYHRSDITSVTDGWTLLNNVKPNSSIITQLSIYYKIAKKNTEQFSVSCSSSSERLAIIGLAGYDAHNLITLEKQTLNSTTSVSFIRKGDIIVCFSHYNSTTSGHNIVYNIDVNNIRYDALESGGVIRFTVFVATETKQNVTITNDNSDVNGNGILIYRNATLTGENLLPENIKKDVTVFGVTGTAETGTEINNQNKVITNNGIYTADEGYTGLGTVTVNVPSTGDVPVKLFGTVEEMQADTTAKEGDLAIVYRSEIQNATVDSTFSTATFPETVVLDTAITNSVYVRYRAVDSSVMFDCWGSLDSSRFSMDCYSDLGEVRIEYTSSDGITYTRTDTTGNPVDFGTEIYYEMTEMWNDAIGKFIQVGGNIFDGLFEYKHLKDNTRFQFRALDTLQYNSETSTMNIVDNLLDTVYDFTALSSLRSTMWSAGTKTTATYLDNNNDLCFIGNNQGGDCNAYFIGENGELSYIGDINSSITKFYIYKINLENKSYELSKTINVQNVTPYGGSKAFKCIPFSELNAKSLPVVLNQGNGPTMLMNAYSTSKNITFSNTGSMSYDELISYVYNMYKLANTQFTSINPNELVSGKMVYGRNGVIESDGSIMIPDNTFSDIPAMLITNIQKQYDSMEPRVLTDDDKTIDTNIYIIPTKSDGTVLLDTSNVTNMGSLFNNCSNLKTIPLLNTSKVTNMSYMFNHCKNLKTIPLLDTSKVTNMTGMFTICEELTEIPLLNTSNVTKMDSIFNSCKNLKTIPLLNTSKITSMYQMFRDCTNLTTIPLLDTSSNTNLQYTFNNCTNLTTVPQLNTSKVTIFAHAFDGCPNLSNESLNNILAMCKNATGITDSTYKTLEFIGLTSEQANICKTLSNYNAFTSAGWTTGY